MLPSLTSLVFQTFQTMMVYITLRFLFYIASLHNPSILSIDKSRTDAVNLLSVILPESSWQRSSNERQKYKYEATVKTNKKWEGGAERV